MKKIISFLLITTLSLSCKDRAERQSVLIVKDINVSVNLDSIRINTDVKYCVLYFGLKNKSNYDCLMTFNNGTNLKSNKSIICVTPNGDTLSIFYDAPKFNSKIFAKNKNTSFVGMINRDYFISQYELESSGLPFEKFLSKQLSSSKIIYIPDEIKIQSINHKDSESVYGILDTISVGLKGFKII